MIDMSTVWAFTVGQNGYFCLLGAVIDDDAYNGVEGREFIMMVIS